MNDNLKPVEEAIAEWIQYFADESFDGNVDDVPESWGLEIPNYLLEDGYTKEQINNAKGYCFEIH